MTTAIIGVGNLGSALARHLVHGGEDVVLAARDGAHSAALAQKLGPLSRSASVSQAIEASDTVVFAVWLDAVTELLSVADTKALLTGKVVIDPTNPSSWATTVRCSARYPKANRRAQSSPANCHPKRTM
jgi:predicted dinucleotide-binding enzyme